MKRVIKASDRLGKNDNSKSRGDAATESIDLLGNFAGQASESEAV